jgi:integrase
MFDWLNEARAGGRSLRTLESYRYPVEKVLLPFLEAEAVHEPRKVDSRLLNRLSARLLDQGGPRGQLSRASVASYLRQIRVFLKWAAAQGEMDAVKVQVPTPDRRIRDTLSRDEIDRLEGKAQTERDKLVIRILADTGIRLGELLALRPGDLRQTEHGWMLRVFGKGRREREVRLLPSLGRRLERYIRSTRPDADCEEIFTTLRRSKRTGHYERLAGRTVEQMLKTVALAADVARERVHPHAFRHSLATHWLLRRGDPIKLAQALGHRDLTMIWQNYGHLTHQDVGDELERLLKSEP